MHSEPTTSRHEAWIEIAVVAIAITLPSVLSKVMLASQPSAALPPPPPPNDPGYLLSLVFRELPDIVLVAFVIYRAREGAAFFSVTRPRFIHLVGGTLLFAGLFALRRMLYPVLHAFLGRGQPHPPPPPHDVDAAAVLIGGVRALTIAVSEELRYRAFFLRRFAGVLGRTWLGVVVSALLFAGLHIRYGAFTVIETFMTGLVAGAVVVRFRSIWPAVVEHTIYDWILFTR